MRFRYREQEGFLEQEFRVQLVVVDRQREQRGVERAFAQALQQHVALFLDQQQFQLRETLADARHHVRQQVGTERGEDAEAHGAGLGIAAAARDFAQLVDLGDDPPRAFDDFAAHRRQHHLARRAFDQRHAEFVFQFPDLRRQRRLADEAGVRGLAEMAVVGERDEVFQVAQVHADGPLSSMVLPSGSLKYSDGPSPSAPKLFDAGPCGASPCAAR